MAIIKIKKKENPFIQIDKTGIKDFKLSWKATGLLTYLIGLPEDWKIHLNHLSKQKKDGLDSTKGALKELRENNYCHYFEIRKQGKVVETFYMVYEIPTPYTEKLLKEIESEYENLEEQNLKIFYKKVSSTKKETAPKVENPLSTKTIETKEISPKVENPLATNSLATNLDLLIIDNTNIESTNKKIMIHDELDFFDKLFNEEFGIPFHYKNQESVKKILKHQKEKEVISYLRETYKNIKENNDVKNVSALFTEKIAKGERQSTNTTNIKITNIEIKKDKEKNRLRNITNYWLDFFEINPTNIDNIKNNFYREIKNFPEELKNEYILKFNLATSKRKE